MLCLTGISLWFLSVSANSPVWEAVNPNIEIPYNADGDYGLQQGIDAVGDVGGLNRDVGLSQFIQDIVVYILSFVSLIAVLYIIYAGFQILIGNGEEEKLKKSKQTILYVILWIVVIWLAWPITVFVISALS